MDQRQLLGLGALGAAAAVLGGVAWMSLSRPETGSAPERPIAAPRPPADDDHGFVAKGHRPQDRPPAPPGAPPVPGPPDRSGPWHALQSEVRTFTDTPPAWPPHDDEVPPEVEDKRMQQVFAARAGRYAELQDRLLQEAQRHPPNEGDVWAELAELRLSFANDLGAAPVPSHLTTDQAAVYQDGLEDKAEAQREAAAEAIGVARSFTRGDDPLSARLDAIAGRMDQAP